MGGCAIISFFRQSCNHQVQEYFINLVRCGDLKAGDKLPPEIDLAQSFSISRNTLREALKSLEALGVLETVRGQGTFVTPDARKRIADMDLVRCFSMENDFQALLEAKNTLVPEMARLAALRRTEEDLAEMGAVLDTPMDSCFSAESMFQIRVASTAKSSVLSGYLRSVYQRLLETEYPKLLSRLPISDIQSGQRQILEAIAQADEESAYQIAKRVSDNRYLQVFENLVTESGDTATQEERQQKHSVFLYGMSDR